MKNIVCLISGRGSNFEAIADAARRENWADAPGARIAAVFSNRADAGGLDIARRHDIPAHVVEHTAFPTREAFEAVLRERIDACDPALVVLAGFMRVLTPSFVAHYEGRMLNIHPSLLPAFPGLHTHRRALAAGVRVHGATVHFVSSEVDGGAIVAQAIVPVEPSDDEDTLAARVLRLEHRMFPRCVRWFAEGRIALADGRVVTRGLGANELLFR